MRFPTNHLKDTGVLGPAGSNYFAVFTSQDGGTINYYSTAANCRLCAHSGLLPVKPRLLADSNLPYYVVPTLRSVMVRAKGETSATEHLLPVPFCAEIVPFNHQLRHPLTWGVPEPEETFPVGLGSMWTPAINKIMRLVPDLLPGDAFNIVLSIGEAAGDPPQGWEENEDASKWLRHGYMTVVYGRDRLPELSAMPGYLLDDLSRHHTLVTGDRSLGAIINASRVAAGTLPDDDQLLWDIWESVVQESDALELFHGRVLGITANGSN